VDQAVKPQQPVALSRGGLGDGAAVGVDVIGLGGVGVEQHVVNDLGGVAHQTAADLLHHGDDRVLVQVVGPGDLGHQLVSGEGLAASFEVGGLGGHVLGARVPVHVSQLEGDVEGVAGHGDAGEQRGYRGLQIHIVPELRGLLPVHQLIPGGSGSSIHGGLQVTAPVFHHQVVAGHPVPGRGLGTPQARDYSQVQGIAAGVLAKGHPGAPISESFS